ncbi:MAG TPA: FAD-dependent oxidoreductase [Lachnospiraceae bacterium]|nr:FAD-dependent oxidoreductase [Lachnospiraceae bacterium]
MNNSIWIDSVSLPEFRALENHITTDVLVIGGGMCGILCAYYLKQAGISYVLVEANLIGHGITKNTTAKVTSQHGLIYQKIEKGKGMEHAKLYLEANQAALSRYRELAQTIDCDFEEKDSYVYSTSDSMKLLEEVAVVQSLGFSAQFVSEPKIPIETQGAVKFPGQAQFHPFKFLAAITKDLNIFENTFIHRIDEHIAYSDHGSITAKQIIVATHFPFLNKHGSFFIKMYQERSYVIALKSALPLDGMYIDDAKGGLSFRDYKDLLLLGGGGHRTGHKGGKWDALRDYAKVSFPNATEQYAWATQDCMSLDGIPYIGQYSVNTPGLYVASGFNKWGMTSSMVAAMILTDMVIGKENDWQKVFSPQRNILKPQLLVNAGEAVFNLLTPTPKRCSHLGCALKWNDAEQTWDCPCHGSRYEKDGTLIDNPSKKDAIL